jgi:adenosylmethionine-8-amino-7-oxononanoate aminotransferase
MVADGAATTLLAMPEPTARRPDPAHDYARLRALDAAHVWHPFTPMRQWREAEPIIIDRAEGFELIDVRGGRFVDGHSSLWCNVHGHRVPEIDRAVRDQLERVAHSTLLGAANTPSIEFAARLVRACAQSLGDDPARLSKVFYSDSGATATEAAFKMAIGHHFHSGRPERNVFVGVSGAYHGDTVGAMSVGYSESMHAPFRRMLFDCQWAPAPDVARQDHPTGGAREWPSWDAARRTRVRDWALARLDETLERVGDRCAGVVVEPLMQGAAGMIEQPEGYLAGLAHRARDRSLLIIADEVAVGFGRTGTLLACEQEGVKPDILCLGKGISGGYLPLAATLCTDAVAPSFEGEPHERRTLYHGHTYTGNPLACAAALASLDLFERNGVLDNVLANSERIRTMLRDALRDHPHVGDVRNRGVMTGIELVASREPWTPFDPARRVGAAVCAAALDRGVLIRPLGDVVILNPAPAMDRGTLGRLLGALVETIIGFREWR